MIAQGDAVDPDNSPAHAASGDFSPANISRVTALLANETSTHHHIDVNHRPTPGVLPPCCKQSGIYM